MEPEQMLLLGAVAFVIFFSIAFPLLRRRHRAGTAKKWARERGWQHRKRDQALINHLEHRDFQIGRSQQFNNVVWGTYGPYTALSGEFQFKVDETDSEGDSTTYTRWIRVSGLQLVPPLPRIAVSPQGMLGRMTREFFKNQNITGDQGFDKAFSVDYADAYAIQHLLGPSVRHYCFAYPKRSFAISGDWIFTWETKKRKFKAVDGDFEYLTGLVARLR